MNASWCSALLILRPNSAAGAVFLRVVDEPEGVVSRARAATEDADHEVRIVLRQLLHRLRTVIDDL